MFSRYLLAILFLGLGTVHAHQPVMDMAPRWAGGYGFQIRDESTGSSEVLNGSSEIDNPLGLERYVDKTWFEGVYTFDSSKRVTFKLPYIEQKQTIDNGGVAVQQENSGWGDLILGVPLKRYWNKEDETGNLSFTPSLRLPTGSTSGDYPLGDGSVDLGLSFAYSKSTPKTTLLADLFYWIDTEGEDNVQAGNELGLDLNLGYHPYHNNENNSGVFVM